ncbi:MAG: phosphatase PAP2 family protein [Gemmatimonadota bacterium]|nr:phosphatase PAP2 family protein [Gemmatimonadota bacterium]
MRLAVLYVSGLLAAAPMMAQEKSDSVKASTEPLFTRRDAVWTGALVAASLLLFQVDDDIDRWVGREGIQESDFVREAADIANLAKDDQIMLAGALVFITGRLAKKRTLADIAWHSTEAVLVSSIALTLVRGSLGRTRPYVTPDNPTHFKGFEGFKSFEHRSFPSIHASANFAVAAVISAEMKRRWPGKARWVPPLLYTAASLPTMSRLYLRRHWASDLLLGSFVGVLTGLKVEHYHHTHPNNKIDRWVLGARPGPNGGAQLILFEHRFGGTAQQR